MRQGEPVSTYPALQMRLDRGLGSGLFALLVAGAYGGAWWYTRHEALGSDRPFQLGLPVLLATLLLILSYRHELLVGRYGITWTSWPVPFAEAHLARCDVQMVVLAKREVIYPRRRVVWDVVTGTRSGSSIPLLRSYPDDVHAEEAAAAVRAALGPAPGSVS
jgi:hypothetical protein